MIKFKEYILLKLGTGGIKITYAWFYITDAVSKELVYIYDLDWLERPCDREGETERSFVHWLILSTAICQKARSPQLPSGSPMGVVNSSTRALNTAFPNSLPGCLIGSGPPGLPAGTLLWDSTIISSSLIHLTQPLE